MVHLFWPLLLIFLWTLATKSSPTSSSKGTKFSSNFGEITSLLRTTRWDLQSSPFLWIDWARGSQHRAYCDAEVRHWHAQRQTKIKFETLGNYNFFHILKPAKKLVDIILQNTGKTSILVEDTGKIYYLGRKGIIKVHTSVKFHICDSGSLCMKSRLRPSAS